MPPIPKPDNICPDCKADLGGEGWHKPGCPDAPEYTCVACLDTGLNSKGAPCRPCVDNGRYDPVAHKKIQAVRYRRAQS